MINYYRDMIRKRSHLIALLSKLTRKSKKKFVWTEIEQKAFEQIKDLISAEVMLTFPDFNSCFHIYTDASDLQLGAVIMQNNKPIAFK